MLLSEIVFLQFAAQRDFVKCKEEICELEEMRVKYWKDKNILSCCNVDFELNLNVHLLKNGGHTSVLYDPLDISNFFDAGFLPSKVSNPNLDYGYQLKVFMYQGSVTTVENRPFVQMYGLKHFFSCIFSSKVCAKGVDTLETKHIKFINWLLKCNLDDIILKTNNVIDLTAACNFCQQVFVDGGNTDINYHGVLQTKY